MEATQNTVTVDGQTIVCKKGPFGNQFVQYQNASIVREGRKQLVKFYALCTANSKEPGRIYACYATLKGNIVGCNTIN